jgi:2-(3-amino-3-carboxypropyl)histidine synthase
MVVDPLRAVEKALPELNFEHLGLATTVQHIGFLSKIAKFLRSHGIKPFVGDPGPRARYPGQILGCDWGAVKSISDEVDGFLYIGTGRFHPLGVNLITGKDVMIANPLAEDSEMLTLTAKDFLNKRRAMISRATSSQRFGILVSVKPGQARFKLAAGLVDDFKRAGLTAHMLVLDEISPEKLEDFKLEAFVCAACPRIPVDDAERFSQPILTPFEAMAMLGKWRLEPYQLDGVRLSDF